jgi:hypothetical protein
MFKVAVPANTVKEVSFLVYVIFHRSMTGFVVELGRLCWHCVPFDYLYQEFKPYYLFRRGLQGPALEKIKYCNYPFFKLSIDSELLYQQKDLPTAN